LGQHEITGGLANLGAVHHEFQVLFFDVLAAQLQAMRHGHLEADIVALGTGRNTALHLGICLSLMGHGGLLEEKWTVQATHWVSCARQTPRQIGQ
jgi:hypothetical protein